MTKWISHMHTHIPSFLSFCHPTSIPSIEVITNHQAELPVLYSSLRSDWKKESSLRLRVEKAWCSPERQHWIDLPPEKAVISEAAWLHLTSWSFVLLLFLFYFYWLIVDLQCFAHYCFTAKWFSYTYIYILFYILFHYGLSCMPC